ncbi:tetratricopeptide repeat protein [Octadecabacter sp. 1_MG-2023]|uniref:tetratricopeptide repeat protein n=1 Tax=unclassified Octadecabacter TaxID=196158 RepID=UPI001C09713A|nr:MULTISPECIES: tetratricopeptide repeat protein [unclassified Octadecabacter]MBU2993757.1 tetratricopeptide repeat protein [Octadecabacter sp. B2R22]MDO6735398.1 tetratricopeptide repeat protein [Octadecabacter sp. 1_MG-2023]
MSNPESFIEEVSEEVRKDQLFGYMRKYGWIAVLAVLLVVGGTAYSEYRKAQTTAAAQAAGDEILAALEMDDDAERAAALGAIELSGGAGAITGLLTASNLVETGDINGAVTALEAVALDDTAPAVYRDLAALKAAMVQGEELSLDDRRAMLTGLATPGSTFRLIAQEQLALLNVEAGDIDTAIDQFAAIGQDAEVTQGLRERAFSMIVALGGDIDALIGNTGQTSEQGDQ